MHLSKYTFKFSVEDGKQVLLYNALTGAIDLTPQQSLESLSSLCATGMADRIADETLAYLLERGYAYRTAEEEQKALQAGFEEFQDRERRSNLRFVLLPTYQCNSRCSYCFIGDAIGQESLMSDTTTDHAFRAMDVLAEERGKGCTRQLSVFGGEPLINTPSQRRVVERILSKGCDRGFLIDVVSNGFDLTDYVDLLRRYGVSKVQVTFDGMREYHNQRRRAVDGRGDSFDRIVAGIDAALSQALPLNVRILLDRQSIRTLPQLVSFFKEKQWFSDQNFSVHLGSVFDCFRCQPKEETAKHLTVEEGNETLYQICSQDRSLADLLSLDWQGIRRFLYTGKLFPPTYRTCFAGTRTFAFDLNGGIYACETTAGRPEYRIGFFSPELNLNHDLIRALEERNVLNIPACRNCSQALLCAGGCAFNAYVQYGSLLAPGCRLLKETLQYGFNYYWPEIKTKLETRTASSQAVQPQTASNCCATSPADVQSFYAAAAEQRQHSLCCPTRYDPELVSHIPEELLALSYGCGAPALKAKILPAQVVVDLGCGAGIDAFLAARFVGAHGRVIGVDLTEKMIEQARLHSGAVAQQLGYGVVEFRLGRMEELPVEDGIADLVISNCALNLVPDKQQVLSEIFRVLKPGGNFILSDVVADKTLPSELQQDSSLWNRCISGALPLDEFVACARNVGFLGIDVELQNPWQEMREVRLFTAILRGRKEPKPGSCVYRGQRVIYKGPFASVTDDHRHTFSRGVAVEICTDTADTLRREPYVDMFLILEPKDLKDLPCCPGKVDCVASEQPQADLAPGGENIADPCHRS